MMFSNISIQEASATFFTVIIIYVKSVIIPSTNTLMNYIQTPGLNIITEYVMGVILPGRPIANVCFKTYGYMSMAQAVSFLNDFKLGHYMKIPPRSMFLVQVHFLFSIYHLTSNRNKPKLKLTTCLHLIFFIQFRN